MFPVHDCDEMDGVPVPVPDDDVTGDGSNDDEELDVRNSCSSRSASTANERRRNFLACF